MSLEIRLVLALALLGLFGWHAWGDRRTAAHVAALEAQHTRDVAALAPLRKANAAWAAADKIRAAEADRDRKERARQAAAAQAAELEARRQAAEASRRAQLFGEAYARRTPTCEAALAALDTACSSFKDY